MPVFSGKEIFDIIKMPYIRKCHTGCMVMLIITNWKEDKG